MALSMCGGAVTRKYCKPGSAATSRTMTTSPFGAGFTLLPTSSAGSMRTRTLPMFAVDSFSALPSLRWISREAGGLFGCAMPGLPGRLRYGLGQRDALDIQTHLLRRQRDPCRPSRRNPLHQLRRLLADFPVRVASRLLQQVQSRFADRFQLLGCLLPRGERVVAQLLDQLFDLAPIRLRS